MHTVCPDCHRVNRLPRERIGPGARCGACRKPLFAGKPIEVDEALFERYLTEEQLPLLVDFWAPWCMPCRVMAPVFEQAARELEPRLRLLKVNTEALPALANRYAIRSIPTLVIFKGGAEVVRHPGVQNLAPLVAWAKKFA